ncbi:MAG: hypothetical protein ACQESF_06770 [Nanobdellota archaeon]
MKIPYSKKATMNIRARIRTKVPWLFGKFTLDEEKITINYFFFTKEIQFKDIKSLKIFDKYLQISLEKETFQINLPEPDKVKKYIENNR